MGGSMEDVETVDFFGFHHSDSPSCCLAFYLGAQPVALALCELF